MVLGAETPGVDELPDSTVSVKKKKSPLDWKPVKWFIKNWTGYDPKYAVPSFYNWALQLQNTTSVEWLQTETPEGMNLEMWSKWSNKIGPYLGWRFLFYGMTIDLNALGKSSKRRNEFTLSINSNLLNIDLIRRRTGGDFGISKLDFIDPYTREVTDLRDLAELEDVGDLIQYDLTGFNLNYFTNHRKYSNPAAFSNGAIQLRSVGSPIIGFGYTHHKVRSDLSELTTNGATLSSLTYALLMDDENGQPLNNKPEVQELFNKFSEADLEAENADDVFDDFMVDFADVMLPYFKDNAAMKTLLVNRIPTTTRIDDWHLQLGYAYNIVFSRRLMLGLSAVFSPGIKRVRANNYGSLTYRKADRLAGVIAHHPDIFPNTPASGDYFRYSYDDSHVNLNLFGKASLVWNYNRWRAGVMASYSNYYYSNNGMIVDNAYGNVTAYVGYCFGRKKEFRYNGKKRQDYINAALTKSQIEEMHDTMPASNLKDKWQKDADEEETPRYHNDRFTLNIVGCDLVQGPDNSYGSFTIEDGFITPGQDSDSRLTKGTTFYLDKNGSFSLQAGHKSNFRAGNWLKKELNIDEIAQRWYPEMLHYVVKGKLTLYLRGRIFGTKKPVKMEIDNVCFSHGKETKDFMLLGIKDFKSKSTFSIDGRTEINDKTFRLYIEQQKRNHKADVFISRIYKSNANWMERIDGNKGIGRLSIPGTHDSGTSSLSESAALVDASHTQNFSMTDQLSDGIRAFDIRLKEDMHYGHTFKCRDRFDSTMVAWNKFLDEHPSECIVAMVGSDEGGKWSEKMKHNYSEIIRRYPHRFIDKFDAKTPLDDVRGKILVIRRQDECPYGKLLRFEDNAVFEYDNFHVEDVYKEHKTYKKIKIVEQNIREAYENEDPQKWYVTFNSIAWSPRRHIPYNYAWGGKAKNIRKPMNKTLREIIELKGYSNFGMVFLDFYNDHGENPQVVNTIIDSNFHMEEE